MSQASLGWLAATLGPDLAKADLVQIARSAAVGPEVRERARAPRRPPLFQGLVSGWTGLWIPTLMFSSNTNLI